MVKPLLSVVWIALHFIYKFGVNGDDGNDLFSSTDDMKKLFLKEMQFSELLKEEINAMEFDIKKVEDILQDFKKEQKHNSEVILPLKINDNKTNDNSNITLPNEQLLRALQFFDSKRRKKETRKVLERLEELPEKGQLEGAFDGLFLLHETYNLNLTDLSMGDIVLPAPEWDRYRSSNRIKSSFGCSVTDLEFLAKHSYNRDYFDRAYEFVKAAENVAKLKQIVDESELKSVRQTLKIIKRDHDVTLMRKGAFGRDWRTFNLPFNKKLRANKMFKNVKNREHIWTPRISEDLLHHFLEDFTNPSQKRTLTEQFKMLCRGERLRPIYYDNSLHSFYLHHQLPYLKLGPFKTETKSKSPYLVIFRDFLHEKEIDEFIDYAQPKLERSTHLKFKGSSKVDDSFGSSRSRTSKQTWVTDISESMPVSRRMELATLTNLTSIYTGGGAEPFQIANYGIGGTYAHHLDADGYFGTTFGEEEEHGDRLATFMGYLTDVDAGGATAFPAIGITAWPKKGDAVYWFNIGKRSSLDWWTYHGGCPVLHGTKWITNKWIRQNAQFKNYPCPTQFNYKLDRQEPFNNPWI